MMYRRLQVHLKALPTIGMVFCAVLSLLPGSAAFAATNQLMITSDSTYQMATGTAFTVSVKAFSDPYKVAGTVRYPADKLKVTGTSPAGGAFGSPAISVGTGTIGFNGTRGTSGAGIVKVFDITFQAIGGGTAMVEFDGSSKVNDGETIYKTAVFSITNPNPPPSTPTAPKPSVSIKPSVAPVPITSTTPTPTPATNLDIVVPTPDPGGIVTNVDVDPSYTSGTVTWKVNATNPKSTVTYGAKSSELDKQATVTQNANGTFAATISDLLPGVRYYFTISGSGDGDKKGTYSSTVTTNGFPVSISVTENDAPAKGAQIRVNNLNRTTTADGKATIGLAAGEYTGKITTSTASLDIKFIVAKKTIPANGSSPEAQLFSYKLSSSPLDQDSGSSSTILTIVGVLIGGTALIGIGFVGFMSYRRRKYETGPGYGSASTTVIIDDGYDWRQQSHAPSSAPSIPTTAPPVPNSVPQHHNNSVYIDEEEPVDMFDKK